MMVRDFQRVIGDETMAQIREGETVTRLLVACVGGGSNAIGSFPSFFHDDWCG